VFIQTDYDEIKLYKIIYDAIVITSLQNFIKIA